MTSNNDSGIAEWTLASQVSLVHNAVLIPSRPHQGALWHNSVLFWWYSMWCDDITNPKDITVLHWYITMLFCAIIAWHFKITCTIVLSHCERWHPNSPMCHCDTTKQSTIPTTQIPIEIPDASLWHRNALFCHSTQCSITKMNSEDLMLHFSFAMPHCRTTKL